MDATRRSKHLVGFQRVDADHAGALGALRQRQTQIALARFARSQITQKGSVRVEGSALKRSF